MDWPSWNSVKHWRDRSHGFDRMDRYDWSCGDGLKHGCDGLDRPYW